MAIEDAVNTVRSALRELLDSARDNIERSAGATRVPRGARTVHGHRHHRQLLPWRYVVRRHDRRGAASDSREESARPHPNPE